MNVRMVVGMAVLMIVAVRMIVTVIVVMIVIVAMAVFVVVVEGFGWLAFSGQDVDFCRVNAAAVYAVHFEMNAEVERIDGILKDGNGNASIDERGEEHVSADTGEAVEIGDLHRVGSDAVGVGSWLFQPMVEAGRRVFMEPLRNPSRSSVTNL